MKQCHRLAALLCVLALLLGLLPPLRAQAAETYTLPVFETSDVHGFLVETTSTASETTALYRMAYIADKVDDARGGDAARTVLLDGGDIYQGNAVSNLQNGEPMVAAFDAMEYDAVSLGNHEFDWGITATTDSDGTMPHYTLAGTEHDSKIPILASNIYYAGTSDRVDFTQDYVILNKTAVSPSGQTRTVRIAVVGYVATYASSIMASEIAPYTILAELNRAEQTAEALKADGRADAAILLAHMDAAALAGQLSDGTAFDLVCGGHSHTGQTGVSGGVTYMQPWSKATAYAYAELCFDGSGAVSVRGAAIESLQAVTERLTDTAANASELAPDVLSLSRFYLENVQGELNTRLGYVTVGITDRAIGGNSLSSTAGNWMTDLANRATGSKVSFTNSGGIRTELDLLGDRRYITKGDVYTIAPFCNLLYVYDLTYSDLLTVLSWGIGRGKSIRLRMSGIDCYYTGSTVTALVEDGVCIYQNGKFFDGYADKHLRVSVNQYIATASNTPFASWNQKCVDSTQVDNESFIRVLEQEGKENDGLLFVDPNAHYINGTYAAPTYTIATSYEGKGYITPTQHVQKGARVVLTIRPDDGWRLSRLVVDGDELTPAEQYVIRSVHADSTIHAVFTELAAEPVDPCAAFTDVDRNAWYHESVDFALAHALFNGCGDGLFEPDGTMTRAMLVTVLWRMEGQPGAQESLRFSDVSARSYYAGAVRWATERGIVDGVGNGRFEPDSAVTREQIAVLLLRYARYRGISVDPSAIPDSFADAGRVSAYAREGVGWAIAADLLRGSREPDGTLRLEPKASATRAQVAALLMRMNHLLQKS